MSSLENLTLGQIKGKVEKAEILPKTKITELEKLLKDRNNVVHQYFKRKPFDNKKHHNNTPFLENEYRFLDKIIVRAEKFNDYLCK
jgi:hypothetical protein